MFSVNQIRQATPFRAGVTKRQYDRLTEIIASLQLELPTFEIECAVREDQLVIFYAFRGEWQVRTPVSLSLVTDAGIDIAQLILREMEPFLAEAPPAPSDAE